MFSSFLHMEILSEPQCVKAPDCRECSACDRFLISPVDTTIVHLRNSQHQESCENSSLLEQYIWTFYSVDHIHCITQINKVRLEVVKGEQCIYFSYM